MTAKRDNPYQFADRLTEWERSFAWLPVKTWDRHWIWLRSYERACFDLKPHLDAYTRGDMWVGRRRVEKKSSEADGLGNDLGDLAEGGFFLWGIFEFFGLIFRGIGEALAAIF